METILQIRHRAMMALRQAGLDDSSVEADIIVGNAIQASRLQMFVQPDRRISAEQLQAVNDALARRITHEPLAYILGTWWFFGREFHVDNRVLVPRPETELLVEQTIAMGHRLIDEGVPQPIIADIGTGSGCIAVSLALALPSSTIYAVDISPKALQVAEMNVHRYSLHNQVMLLSGDLAQPLPEPVHLLVANLPYVDPLLAPQLQREVTAFEPQSAWDGGQGGLAVLGRFLRDVWHLVRPEGCVLLEVGEGQAATVAGMASELCPGCRSRTMRDLGDIERVVIIERACPQPDAGGAPGTQL